MSFAMVRVHKFQNVANLTFLFKSDDADVLQLNYLGLKGSSTGVQSPVVRAV